MLDNSSNKFSQDHSREYKLVFPKNDNQGDPIPRGLYEGYIRKISNHFGGVTIQTDIVGCWNDTDRNKLQCEPNIIISTIRSENDAKTNKKDLTFLNALIQKIGIDFGQDTMLSSSMKCDANFTKCEWRPKISQNSEDMASLMPLSILEKYIPV